MKKITFTSKVMSNMLSYEPVKLTGRLFTLKGHDFVVHRPTYLYEGEIAQSENSWAVSHYATGRKLYGDSTTMAKAVEGTEKVLDRRLSEFLKFLETAEIINQP